MLISMSKYCVEYLQITLSILAERETIKNDVTTRRKDHLMKCILYSLMYISSIKAF